MQHVKSAISTRVAKSLETKHSLVLSVFFKAACEMEESFQTRGLNKYNIKN